MSEQLIQATDLGPLLDSETLRDWMVSQRWYASKSRGLSGVELVEAVELADDLYLALVQTRLATGAHEIYQLLLAASKDSDDTHDLGPAIIGSGGVNIHDALNQPRCALAITERMTTDGDITTDGGHYAFRHIEGAYQATADSNIRLMGAQQSNSSLVIDEHVALKLFRRVESGINPELEMLRFLTTRGFEHVPALEGWYEYEGSSLASTLGTAQAFIGDGRDGWDLALELIRSDPDLFLKQLAELGRVTAEMHTVLASDSGDPAFSPEEPTSESLSLLTASIDEDIERIFMRLSDDNPAVEAIYGRGDDVRAKLATQSQIAAGGKLIRIHGDYHLGQTLQTPRGWIILDFEGEPGRPLPERRKKQSSLRDVAGLLRSLAYATSAAHLQNPEAARLDDFEQRGREAFLDAYLHTVEPSLLPAGAAAIKTMLTIYELEKAVYELRYELNNRPDWVAIPVEGITRLLDES